MKNLHIENDNNLRIHLLELLRGGFAPVVVLLREFHFNKAGVVMQGLHFSVWSLLRHMIHRQKILLNFVQNPEINDNVWPEPYWPQDFEPGSEQEWSNDIEIFEKDLEEMIRIVKNPETNLYETQSNGKSLFWAAIANLQHNGYHIGQIKAIGRQLGVW